MCRKEGRPDGGVNLGWTFFLTTMSTAERRSPRKGIPLLSLKLSTPAVPQLAQSTFSPPTEAAWFGNVGAKRYFLGTRDAEGLSDEDLYNLFLQKESSLFAAKNSQTPFQYTQSTDVRLFAFLTSFTRIPLHTPPFIM